MSSDVLLIVLAVVMTLVAAGTVTARLRSRGGDEAEADELWSDPADLQERVRQLSARGRKIEAIKILRVQLPGLDLRKAKAAAEAVEAGHSLESALAQTGYRPPSTQNVPPDLQRRVRERYAQGQPIEAIKILRRQMPSLSLKRAKLLAEALASAPAPAVPAASHDLAARIRALKAEGRTEQAVHLIRGETGMGHAEAVAFVEAIQLESDTL